MKLSRIKEENAIICLPESFEWLTLKDGIITVRKDETTSVLNEPESHIDSSEYFNWEVFFHRFLVDVTKDTSFRYTKSRINKVYIIDTNAKKIVAEIIE